MALSVVGDEMPVVNSGAPAVVEQYGEQVRQSFLDREDKLHFRTQEGGNICRMYGPNRPDSVREVEETECSRHIIFGQRPDDLVDYLQETVQDASGSQTTVYTAKFSGPSLKSGHIAMQPNQQFEPGCDTPVTIFREKALHVALKFDASSEETPFRIVEVFQDQQQRLMRVVCLIDDLGHKETLTFPNSEPNNDDRYSFAKESIANFIQLLVALERDLFINLPDFVPGESASATAAKQNERLHKLARSLFSSIDAYTSPVKGEL